MRRTIRILSLLAAITGLAASSPARAADGEHASDWVGRYCTRPGCVEASRSPLATAAGFGAAVLAAGLIARRRDLAETS